MVACNEISREYVALLRPSEAAGMPAVAERPSEPAVAAVAEHPSEPAATGHAAPIMEALAWAALLSYDDALLAGLAGSLPGTVLEEQLRLYEASQAIVARPS